MSKETEYTTPTAPKLDGALREADRNAALNEATAKSYVAEAAAKGYTPYTASTFVARVSLGSRIGHRNL